MKKSVRKSRGESSEENLLRKTNRWRGAGNEGRGSEGQMEQPRGKTGWTEVTEPGPGRPGFGASDRRPRVAGMWETDVRGIKAVREAEDPFQDTGARNPRRCPGADDTGLLPAVWG